MTDMTDLEDVIRHITELYCPTAVVQVFGNMLQIDAAVSLYRLGTVLEGAVEMHNAIYSAYRIVWIAKSKNYIRLELITL